MSDREEWTEWRLHDGSGCPCPGMWVRTELANGVMEEHIAHGVIRNDPDGTVDGCCDLWDYATLLPGDWPDRVIRYQIKTPRALQQLRDMIETLPAPEREDA